MQAQDTATTTRRTTRHHRVDEDFLEILHEDFGISMFALSRAFMGVPPAPKRQAISLCEWAVKTAGGEPVEASDALRAWATKNRCGQYDPRIQDSEPMTFGGRPARGV